jgi:Protein of unknown function/Domain of unknown function (DUF1835)
MARRLHIAPSDSAGGSLRHALRATGHDDEVLAFRDDLSCGPIQSGDPATRAQWWSQFYEATDVEHTSRAFWERVAHTEDRLVVWFGRHSANELSFFLAWTDRLADREYDIVDVTRRRLPIERPDGSIASSRPVQCVAILPPDMMRSLFGAEQPIADDERERSRQSWSRLRCEDAPFRIVTELGLASAPVDHFDPLILQQARPAWRTIARVVGDTMGHNSAPYIQVYDLMLLTRVVALVGEGTLLVQGDPWEMRSRVRLPA